MNELEKIKFEDGSVAFEEFFGDKSIAEKVTKLTQLAASIPYVDKERQCINFCREVYSDISDLLTELDLLDTFTPYVVTVNNAIDEDGNPSEFSHAVVIVENTKVHKGIMIEPQDVDVKVIRYDNDPDSENIEALIRTYINKIFRQKISKFKMYFGQLEREARKTDDKNSLN